MIRLMVLGLLRVKSMSGYEIQQILQTSKTDLWAGILPGSIYHALKKMEKGSLVEVESVEQTGHRIKAIYKINDQGEQEYFNLLKKSLEVSSVKLPTELYTGMGFIQDLSKEDVLNALFIQKTALEAELEMQKDGIEMKRQVLGELDKITQLTAQNIFKQYEIQIDFIEQLTELFMKK
ncbi:PadR family transcriptional regulator [Lysinibacillus antri]|uniref:PadR family transcriptional regulator n=1 Tax=Lysinibacillus antri TaxID=2498145 RepID=A0A3S0QN31_9BACI|nr:PadR family transcriptional regulator [Lysinibacillus antri]RUL47908.1 PadR family transcriptional regulator [Lysinibacillus antri]